jgi:calcium-dependent protein kinase
MTKKEMESLSKIFKEIDTNGDGKLSKQEILDGYTKYFNNSIDKKDVLKIFHAVDTDKSDFIDYSEFLIASFNEKQLLTE